MGFHKTRDGIKSINSNTPSGRSLYVSYPGEWRTLTSYTVQSFSIKLDIIRRHYYRRSAEHMYMYSFRVGA